jgi:hypothetical protein
LDATQLPKGQQSVKQESKQDIILRLTEGLNAQQRSVPQLPAQAQARKIKVLGSKTDPKHPFAGYMVGADESAEPGKKNIGPDKNDPYEKGWRAGFGHSESNPYPAGSKQAAQWDRGYAEAEAQPNHYDESLAEVDFNPGRRGFLKKAGAVAATAAMPAGLAGAAAKAMAPAASWASTLSAPLAGLTAIDLDDIINLLMTSNQDDDVHGPYDLDTIKKIAVDAARESWGNAWFMNGNAAKALLDTIELGKKKGMDDEDIIQDIFIVTKKQYMQELKQLSPEEVAKVKSQSLNPDNKSEPAASPTTGMSGLARAAGAQIGRTMKNVGKATATTVLNQPARDMGRIEPTAAPAALPAPSVSPGMQIPKQKSRVAASPFNDDHSELDQFVKEEFNRDPDDLDEYPSTVGRNNPAAAWPDFGTAKTYESQLAEAKQRLAEAESRYVLYFNGKPASHYATEAEAKKFADFVKTKYPTVKIEIKNEMHEGVAEGYKFKGGFPFDVDHMSGAVHKQDLDTKKKFTDEELWLNTVNKLNSSLYDDNSDYISSGNGYRVEIMGKVWAKWDGVKDAGWIETSSLAEGARVDRMVKHIASSEKATGKSNKDAENIAWATVNKRGYLDNKNKKKHVAEAGTPADIRAKNRAVVKKIQGKEVKEDITQEDIITKLKAKLGDYLSDLGQQIKKDPALQDKLSAETPGDQVGPPVKTLTTDDGHEISIHGNEDDGFRISIKNKQTPSKFDSLDEAVMACEMYRAHRRKQALTADYVEEA